MPDITMRFPKVNQLNVKSVMFTVQSKLHSDPAFAEQLKADPVGVLQQFGIPRTVAVAIVADDVGVSIRPSGAAADEGITSCCCSGCSFSHDRSLLDDSAVLPAANDLQAWNSLVNKRTRPSVMIDHNAILGPIG